MTDEQLTNTIRRLLAAEEKPRDVTPLDLLQTIRLLVQGADERHLGLSQNTLALQLASSPDAIGRSQKRLIANRWVTVQKGGYRGRTNLVCVALDGLPVANLRRSVTTIDARRLALDLGNHLRVRNRKRLLKQWLQRWAFQIQKLIDRTNGSEPEVRNLINFALACPKYRSRAQKGPDELQRCWSEIRADYARYQAQLQREKKTGGAESGQSKAVAAQ